MNEPKKVFLAWLDDIHLRTELWEDDEAIMTFNGKPIGMTISRRGKYVDIDRWWPELKVEIARFLAENIYGEKEERES